MLDDYAGLARRRPWLAASMVVFLLSLAGVPALAGFVGKWYVFRAAVVGGHTELAIIGALASAVGIFYYLRVVWAMYFTDLREQMAAPRPGFTPTPEGLRRSRQAVRSPRKRAGLPSRWLSRRPWRHLLLAPLQPSSRRPTPNRRRSCSNRPGAGGAGDLRAGHCADAADPGGECGGEHATSLTYGD